MEKKVAEKAAPKAAKVKPSVRKAGITNAASKAAPAPDLTSVEAKTPPVVVEPALIGRTTSGLLAQVFSVLDNAEARRQEAAAERFRIAATESITAAVQLAVKLLRHFGLSAEQMEYKNSLASKMPTADAKTLVAQFRQAAVEGQPALAHLLKDSLFVAEPQVGTDGTVTGLVVALFGRETLPFILIKGDKAGDARSLRNAAAQQFPKLVAQELQAQMDDEAARAADQAEREARLQARAEELQTILVELQGYTMNQLAAMPKAEFVKTAQTELGILATESQDSPEFSKKEINRIYTTLMSGSLRDLVVEG